MLKDEVKTWTEVHNFYVWHSFARLYSLTVQFNWDGSFVHSTIKTLLLMQFWVMTALYVDPTGPHVGSTWQEIGHFRCCFRVHLWSARFCTLHCMKWRNGLCTLLPTEHWPSCRVKRILDFFLLKCFKTLWRQNFLIWNFPARLEVNNCENKKCGLISNVSFLTSSYT